MVMIRYEEDSLKLQLVKVRSSQAQGISIKSQPTVTPSRRTKKAALILF